MIATEYIKKALVLLIFLMAGRLAGAQSSLPGTGSGNATLPEGELLKSAPEFSRWTVDYSYPQDRQDAGKRTSLDSDLPRSITTTKTRQILHEETLTVGGKKMDSWQQNEEFYTKVPERNSWAAYEKPTQTQIDRGSYVVMTIPKSGFRSLEWIGAKTYLGSLKSKDLTYLVFVPDILSLNLKDTKALQAQPTIAYVDEDSRLPVVVTEGNVSRAYKFEKLPSVMQKLPDDLLAEIKQGDEMRAKFNAAPKREY